jgi:hypothetical protein
MTDTRDIVKRTVESTLRGDGWVKSGGSWYKRSTETLLAVDLQKSTYSKMYFLNLGIFLPPVDSVSTDFGRAPISLRVESLPRAKSFNPRSLFDLEFPMEEADRQQKIRELMEDVVFAEMNKCGTVEALKPNGAAESFMERVPLLGAEALFLRPGGNRPIRQ